MAMEPTCNPVRVLDICRVTPAPNSPESATELSLPLTFFDTLFFKFHPMESIFFYELANSTPEFFNSVILPKLKHSLSLTLPHFLPLAGNLVWPPEAAKPFILYTPNDNVLFIVAESHADFHHLASNESREVTESRPYIPELPVSDSKAEIVALQITLFPNQGFSVGISSHHVMMDGKSTTTFLKAWAHMCKQNETEKNPTLSSELTPFLDRTIIQDPEGLDMIYLNNWLSFKPAANSDANLRSLKLVESLEAQSPNFGRVVRATFELSREDITKLKQKVLSQLNQENGACSSIHLSSFVVSYAYLIFCIFKAKQIDKNKKVSIGFSADCRTRLDPPIPINYFGNCVTGHSVIMEAEVVMQENGFAMIAKRLSEWIKGLEKEALEGAKEILANYFATEPGTVEGIGVAGSPRFEAYRIDFGWGKPKKVEVASIGRDTGAISMAESKDGNGGIEIGVVLKKHDMEIFQSLFVNGLNY